METNREQEVKRKIALFCTIGICLMGFVFFAPDPGSHPGLNFIRVARQSSWHRSLDWEAAWCSIKMILLSLGLSLIIESLGTWFMKAKHVFLGVLMYLLHVVPLIGLLAGSYYLVKSLL